MFGNEVSGLYSISQSNAGYIYEDYKGYKNGNKVSLPSLLPNYLDSILCNKYSKIKYISGYKNNVSSDIYPAIPQTAHILTGVSGNELKHVGPYIVYYYLILFYHLLINYLLNHQDNPS